MKKSKRKLTENHIESLKKICSSQSILDRVSIRAHKTSQCCLRELGMTLENWVLLYKRCFLVVSSQLFQNNKHQQTYPKLSSTSEKHHQNVLKCRISVVNLRSVSIYWTLMQCNSSWIQGYSKLILILSCSLL